MNRKLHYLNLGTVLLTMAMGAFAQKVIVYRWVDKENIVHFSQHQPEHEIFTEMNVADTLPVERSLPLATTSPALDIIDIEDESPSTEDLFKSEMSDKCLEAQTNSNTLKSFDNIQTTDIQGETSILTQQQKKQQLEMSLKRIDVYCSSR